MSAELRERWIPASHVRVRYREPNNARIRTTYLAHHERATLFGLPAIKGEMVRRDGEWIEKYKDGVPVETRRIIHEECIVDVREMEQSTLYATMRVKPTRRSRA